MRKFAEYLLAVCLVLINISAAFADVPIDEGHFPDTTFRAYVILHFDKDGDGVLNDEEIKNATYIDVLPFDYYLKSLKGVEYLTALKVLRCVYCNLFTIDLSRNTAL